MNAHKQGGSVLLEALVSILIFSFGVIALFGAQAVAVQNVSQSNNRAAAVFLASQLIGTVQGDINHLADYNYTTGTPPTKVQAWLTQVAERLPNGAGTISAVEDSGTPPKNGTITVTVTWQAPGKPVNKYTVASYVAY